MASLLNYHFNWLGTDHRSSDALPDKPHPFLHIPVPSAGYLLAAVIALTAFLQLRTFNARTSSYHGVSARLHPHAKQKKRRALPVLKVRVVLRVMLVAGLLQGVVEKKSVLFINVNRSQVGAPPKPPLPGAWDTAREPKKETTVGFDSMAQWCLTPTGSSERRTLTVLLLDLKVSVVEVHGGDVGVLWVNDRAHAHGAEGQLAC